MVSDKSKLLKMWSFRKFLEQNLNEIKYLLAKIYGALCLAKNEVFKDHLIEVNMKIQLHKSVSLWNHFKTDIAWTTHK